MSMGAGAAPECLLTGGEMSRCRSAGEGGGGTSTHFFRPEKKLWQHFHNGVEVLSSSTYLTAFWNDKHKQGGNYRGIAPAPWRCPCMIVATPLMFRTHRVLVRRNSSPRSISTRTPFHEYAHLVPLQRATSKVRSGTGILSNQYG